MGLEARRPGVKRSTQQRRRSLETPADAVQVRQGVCKEMLALLTVSPHTSTGPDERSWHIQLGRETVPGRGSETPASRCGNLFFGKLDYEAQGKAGCNVGTTPRALRTSGLWVQKMARRPATNRLNKCLDVALSSRSLGSFMQGRGSFFLVVLSFLSLFLPPQMIKKQAKMLPLGSPSQAAVVAPPHSMHICRLRPTLQQ